MKNCSKAICLCGGSGTRLHPLTKGISKQLLPLFSKPLCYYPISILMLSGIRDILIITTPHEQECFKRLLGDGSQFGINFTYATQPKPEGLAQAFLIAEECGFLHEGESCGLVLGDNIFYCSDFQRKLKLALSSAQDGFTYGCATIFGIEVKDPERYGIVEIDKYHHAISIEEKPKNPKSNICVTGLYFYPNDILKKAHAVKPSARGELEITSINQMYLKEDNLRVELLARGDVWLDTGTFDSLSEAGSFVEAVEKRSGKMICCPEEIAYTNGWITKEKLIEIGNSMSKNEYGQYLLNLAKNG